MKSGASPPRSRLPWMVSFLGRRLLWAVYTMFLYLTFVFFFVQWWVPIDFTSQFGRESEAAAMRFGLDQPVGLRYFEWMSGLLTGDMGGSFQGEPVTEILSSAAAVTILVFAVGAVIAYVTGEYLGRVAAWRRRTVRGSVVSVLGVLSATIFPPFLVFLLVRYLRAPMISARDAIGLPVDSLDLWRESRAEPPEVLLLVALALLSAVVGGLLLRAYAHRLRLRWLSLVAFPVPLLTVPVAVHLAGVSPEAVDLMYRVETDTAIGTGSPILVMVGVVLLSFGQVLFMMRGGGGRAAGRLCPHRSGQGTGGAGGTRFPCGAQRPHSHSGRLLSVSAHPAGRDGDRRAGAGGEGTVVGFLPGGGAPGHSRHDGRAHRPGSSGDIPSPGD